MAVTGVGFVPTATATIVTPPGVAAGKNITVFHNIDFVATFGWNVGDIVTVDVLRNGALIGTSTGPAVDTPEGGALEVNHGPEGAPQPGDCWVGHTPDVRPGDLVRVSGAGTVSEVLVDGISLSGAEMNGAIVEVRGVALLADGVTAIDPDALDSGEFRSLIGDEQFRATPERTIPDPTLGAPTGAFVMQYDPPYTGDVKDPAGATEDQRRLSLLNDDGHATGFGHVAPPPPEAMLVEGYGDSPGPALGCEGSVAATESLSVSPSKINLANANSGVTVSGLSAASPVTVTLSDGDGTTFTTADITVAGGTYSADISAAELTGLDGVLTATASHGGANVKTLIRDVIAPAAPSMSPNGGAIAGPTSVFLTGAAGDTLRFTTGNGSQAAPTASTGAVYSGPFTVSAGQTVKAIAVDAADNTSGVTTGAFTAPAPVTRPPRAGGGGAGAGGGAAIIPNSPRIGEADAGRRGGNRTAKARWDDPRANGAVVDGYDVRAVKIRRGPDKIMNPVAVAANRNRLNLSLARGLYKFQVRASSAAGNSDWSERSNKVRAR